MGRKEQVKSGHLSIFTSLKHLMVLLRCKIFRASFLHLIKDTDFFGLFWTPVSDVFLASTNAMETMITSLAAQGGGGGGLKPYCLRLSLRQSAIGTYCVGLDIKFLLGSPRGGGGGLNPLTPPPLDPPLDSM